MKIISPREAQESFLKVPAPPRTDFDTRQHYHELICGHLADLDTDAAYRTQASPRKKLFCETCGKWRLPKPKPKRSALPDTPLF